MAGLIDYLVAPSIDENTKEELPALGVINDEDRKYKNIENGGNIIPKMIYIVKADPKLNKEGYTNVLTQMGSNKLQFLINEREAKEYMPENIKKSGELAMRDYLKPHILTSVLETELLNLAQSETSEQFKLVQMNKSTGKDKVSSLMYALYVIKQDEDKERNRKKRNLADFVFFG